MQAAALFVVGPRRGRVVFLFAGDGRGGEHLRVVGGQPQGDRQVVGIGRRQEFPGVPPAVQVGPAVPGVLRDHLADRGVGGFGPMQLGPT